MSTFPKLKTNAVTQYPIKRSVRFRNQILRFVDGTEQRYRDCASGLHRWEISLTQLDEGEMAAFDEFFAGIQGSFDSFTFVDPVDGHRYDDCSLESDDLDLLAMGEMNGWTLLKIVENRSKGC